MKHVMLDLETLGDSKNSAFLSLAAVPFDKDRIGDPFMMNVQLKSTLSFGLEITSSTIEWWLSQDPTTMRKMFINPKPLYYVLKFFEEWWNKGGFMHPWGNGAAFDISLIVNAYEKTKLPVPWKMWNERCFRTVLGMFPEHRIKPPAGVAHDPVEDCKAQIISLQKVCAKINYTLE